MTLKLDKVLHSLKYTCTGRYKAVCVCVGGGGGGELVSNKFLENFSSRRLEIAFHIFIIPPPPKTYMYKVSYSRAVVVIMLSLCCVDCRF